MRASARAGFTLVELVLSLALGAVVLVGLSKLMVPLTRAQILAARGQTTQLSLVSAQKAVERAVRQATWLGAPSAPGLPSERLEGCENAAPVDAARFAPIDPSRPMRWFGFCYQDGVLYDHGGDGCPPQYLCGVAPLGAFGGGTVYSTATARFTRESAYTTDVDIELTFVSGDASSQVRSAAAFSAAAGSNQ